LYPAASVEVPQSAVIVKVGGEKEKNTSKEMSGEGAKGKNWRARNRRPDESGLSLLECMTRNATSKGKVREKAAWEGKTAR